MARQSLHQQIPEGPQEQIESGSLKPWVPRWGVARARNVRVGAAGRVAGVRPGPRLAIGLRVASGAWKLVRAARSRSRH
jgi:hypothetical protein